MKLFLLLMFVSGAVQAQWSSRLVDPQVTDDPVNAEQLAGPKVVTNTEVFVQQELHHKLFWSSVFAFGVSSGFDYATSIKLNDAARKGEVRERNTFLRNSYGGFDPAKGLAVKGGARAVLVITEVFLRRKLGKPAQGGKVLDRTFTALNYALAGFFVRIGVNNVQIGRKYGVY